MNTEAHTLFSTVRQLLPTPYQQASFDTLIAAFLEADGNPRPTRAQVHGKSQSALSRFLNRYAWPTRALVRTLRREVHTRVLALAERRAQHKGGRKPILEVSLDGTCLGLVRVVLRARGPAPPLPTWRG